MSIILFATLSVPALGGAESLREAAPRVPAFGELMGQMPTPPTPASIGQLPYLHSTSVTQSLKVRLSQGALHTHQQQQRKLRPREMLVSPHTD